MRKTVWIVPVAAAVAVAVLGGWVWTRSGGEGQAGLLPWRDAEAVALGAALYAEHCAACHGVELEGAGDWRTPEPGGFMPAPPHDDTGHTWHHPDAQLFALTKHGVEAIVGNGYRSNMPGFSDVLSDAEILAVLAYIKSTWPADIQARHDEINRAAAQAEN